MNWTWCVFVGWCALLVIVFIVLNNIPWGDDDEPKPPS
jgi:hypothetical protein